MTDAIPLAVLIPAYKPSLALVDVVEELARRALPAIVIVDDGSGPEFADVFSRAAAFPNVRLLRHAVNLGKGAALKTGINFALCSFPGLVGIVTADADGQHHPDDIERVATTLTAQPESLVLGSRQFAGEVPLRSRIGNVATRAIMHAVMGRKLTDTQTGLRGIPASLLPRILRLESTGYEYELEMLIAAHQLAIPIVEVPIRTIYEPGNRSSHFNPVVDSMKIYFVLLRFGSVSFLTAALDNLVFYLAYRASTHILISQILGRVFAVGFNYSMVRNSVFYTRQRHKSVLPRYLLLVLVSGSASYAGIRLVTARLGIGAVAAKLAVETVLFFVNFAVQRMFIFKPESHSDAPPALPEVRPRPKMKFSPVWLLYLVFAGLVGVEGYGLYTGHLFSQEIWMPVGLARLARFSGIFLAFAVPLLLMVPWTFAAFATAVVLILTAVSLGPQAVVATAFFLVASCALGSMLLGRKWTESLESDLCATLLGTGVYIFLMTFLARLPVNYPLVWFALLAAPVAAAWRGVLRRLSRWAAALGGAELRVPADRAALALLVFILLTHWFAVLKPEASADGLSMHLAIPANIAANHMMTFRPDRLLWAVMPMGADWTYSIAFLLGGEGAARLLNFAMLLVLEGLLYCAVRRWVSRSAAFVLLALFAATPMVQLVTGSLFVENVLAAMILGAMTALWRLGETGEKRHLYLAAVMGGTAMAVKLGALAFVALAVPFLLMEGRRRHKSAGPVPVVSFVLAGALFLAAAVPAYAIAWRMTGNPLFPFLNARVHSPVLDPAADIDDVRYKLPLSGTTPYKLAFRTSQYFEGQDGSMGFQYLVLAPLGLMAILLVKRRAARSGAVVALGAAVIILGTQPNARYLYPALPLLSVPFAALLGWVAGERRRLYRVLMVYLVACTALDAYFLPSSSYYHKDFSMPGMFSRAARARYVGETAPIREVIAYFERTHPRSAVLLTADSYIAGLTGDVYENHWHQFAILDRIRKTSNLPDMLRLLEGWKVHYLIARVPKPGDYTEPVVLRQLLESCTIPEYEFGGFYLSRLDPDCQAARDASGPAIVATRDTYDDFDPALRFRGTWNRDDTFDGPARHTISFSGFAGDEVSFAFEGKSLTYVFTKAPNRGLAGITIDGVSKEPVDLYSPKVEWQSRMEFCCLGAGKHLAVIRVLGQKQPASTGVFVDVDALTVR